VRTACPVVNIVVNSLYITLVKDTKGVIIALSSQDDGLCIGQFVQDIILVVSLFKKTNTDITLSLRKLMGFLCAKSVSPEKQGI